MKSFQLSTFALKFPDEIEAQFLESNKESSTKHIRITLLIGFILFGLLGMIDYVVQPHNVIPLWIIRYGFVCPVFLFTFVATFHASFKKSIQEISVLTVLVAGLGMLALMYMDESKFYSTKGYAVLSLLILTAYMFLRLRFMYAFVTSWSIILVYEYYALFVNPIPLSHMLFNNILLVGATLLGMVSCYIMEIYIRQEFMLKLSIEKEQEKSEHLLLNILPKSIADRLKAEENSTIADSFAEVSILFADIVEFTDMSAHAKPAVLVSMLNEIFSSFDQLVERYGLEKIKTIGDAYMVAGGLPIPRTDHAEAIADLAFDLLKVIESYNAKHNMNVHIKVGINSGPVVAGVIGKKKFIYDLWGDTVNIASRMESYADTSSIHVSEATYDLLKDHYEFKKRLPIQVKGKGTMQTYFLTQKKPRPLQIAITT